MSDGTPYVGSVRKPKIQVLDPTDEQTPLELPEAPTVKIIGPNGTSTVKAEPDDEDPENAWQVKYELTAEGDWYVVVDSPAPYKGVEVDSIYANPLPG